jgi:peptidoglycan/xylan/chitin deacetylase (PgdA/CDA1 family)
MKNLWSDNTSRKFWHCQPDPSSQAWATAVQMALPILDLPTQLAEIDTALSYTLGELQFGPDQWRLSKPKQWYYNVKPIMPRFIIDLFKRANSISADGSFPLSWPSESRYINFQWDVLRQLLVVIEQTSISIRNFWPDGRRFAFVLTHDVETEKGQDFVRNIADLEEKLGFRSSFNFVPESYPLDEALMVELRERGFEIGVHGLKHDGKLYQSYDKFMRRAERINHHLKQFGAVGFRSPYMHRQPEWLQALDIEYDLSFFDTDPYEPIPGGCMSIWPFRIGRFIELPYTLCQDSTLGHVLGETTPKLWLEKLNMIEENYGMALLNSHPDYLIDPVIMRMYRGLLTSVVEKKNYWHALPVEVASWWRRRSDTPSGQETTEMITKKVSIRDGIPFITNESD